MSRFPIGLVLVVAFTVVGLPCGVFAQSLVESNVHKREVRGQAVKSERDEQEALFNYYFHEQGLKYETKLAELKKSASVPSWRIPYSADIHPQTSGGLSEGGGRRRRSAGSSALSLYDRAFNEGRDSANGYELRRVLGTDRAVFPGLRMRRNNEGWEGYCSGFTAATIRHPEPIHPVDAGKVGGTPGVVLQPSDIKALLSCIYNRTTDDSFLFLAPASARDGGPNMGTFHLTLGNYIGRAGCPIGFDRTKGEAPWNNPIYAYEVTSLEDAGQGDNIHYKNVETTITYSFYGSDTAQQTDVATGEVRGNEKQSMVLRYTLGLDNEGRIVGGTAHSDCGYFLWLPLYAVQGKADGSAPGNPHVDVKKVIALARASALPEAQKKFDEVTIGPRVDPAVEPPKP